MHLVLTSTATTQTNVSEKKKTHRNDIMIIISNDLDLYYGRVYRLSVCAHHFWFDVLLFLEICLRATMGRHVVLMGSFHCFKMVENERLTAAAFLLLLSRAQFQNSANEKRKKCNSRLTLTFHLTHIYTSTQNALVYGEDICSSNSNQNRSESVGVCCAGCGKNLCTRRANTIPPTKAIFNLDFQTMF